MSGVSKRTTIVPIRLPNEIVAILKRRAANYQDGKLSSYLRDRIIYDVSRKR